MTTVSGTIVLNGLPASAPPFPAKSVVRVRDVTLADSPRDVAATEMFVTVDPQAADPLTFRLDVDGVDAADKGVFNLSVHIDMDGSGFFSTGDLISMDEYPVITHGAPTELNVDVHLIT